MDVVEYVEKCFNNELREYQKILLHNAVHEKKYYITYPPHCGRTYFTEMIKAWNELNESKN